MENSELIRLINSAKEGNSEAFSRLFAEYKNEVYSIAMRETKDRSLSDDIVQETFVEVILKINDLKNAASFPAWLKMIAYHQCTRHYKKKETVHEIAAIENDDGLSVFDTVEETNASFIPDDALDQKEFKATILEMIDELPDAQRAALYMFYFEEMPLKVIAKVQGVSVNTANTRLNRGRLAMKGSIEKYEKKHGIRLHSIAFFPFFRWLLKGTEEVMPDKAAAHVAQTISAKTGIDVAGNAGSVGAASFGVAATTNTGAIAADVGLKTAATGMITKVIAGIAALSVAVGGVAVYQSANKQDEVSSISVVGQRESTAPENINEGALDDSHKSNTESLDVNIYSIYEDLLKTGITSNELEINFFTYLDLDCDGVKELIVADRNGTPETMTQCEIYTLKEKEIVYVGNSGAYWDHLYHVNNNYVRGCNRLGAQYTSVDEHFSTAIYHWNDAGDRNDPAISRNGGEWEYISKEEFEHYNMIPGGFVETFEIITFQENTLCERNILEQTLDFSKSWGISIDVPYSYGEGYTQQICDFAFSKDGSFACFFYQTYTDFFTGYYGTYSVSGNQITFAFNDENGDVFSYVYALNPDTLQLTQVSDKGLWGTAPGEVYQLVTDETYPTAQSVRDRVEWVIGS